MECLRSHPIPLLRRIYGFVFVGVSLVAGSVVQAASGSPVNDNTKHELNLIMDPPFGYINTLENIKFRVFVKKGAYDVIDTVRLVQTDEMGIPLAEAGEMTDDGQNGDRRAGDGQYTATLSFNEPAPVIRYYQAVVNLKNDSRKILSDVRELRVTEKPYSKELDEDKLIHGVGYPFPVNRVIMLLNEDETKVTAQALAESVGGAIVGYTPSINLYELEVPAKTVEELDVIIDRLDTDPRTKTAMRSLVSELE